MRIEVYNSDRKEEWDSFVRNSKNGTFLFYRDFMEYHASRFKDYSLMFFVGDELIALMPGHIEERVYCTHRGLTYGGLVMSLDTTAGNALEIFDHLVFTLKQQGFDTLIYKSVPHIYHKYPAEEDLYALFRHGATIQERNISTTVLLDDRMNYSRTRKNGVRKAQSNNMRVECSDDDLFVFWNILEHNLLSKYNKKPVHSFDEMADLKQKFPDNIHLYVTKDIEGKVEAGCILFETDKLIHVQYSASSEKGKNVGAMDFLIDHVISIYAEAGKRYFDYGISNEQEGLYLNEKLIYQKEGFGGRGTVSDVYMIKL